MRAVDAASANVVEFSMTLYNIPFSANNLPMGQLMTALTLSIANAFKRMRSFCWLGSQGLSIEV
jgi:hypothetical protein